MRIVIDARLNAYRQGGIAQYTLRLIEALAPLTGADRLIVLQHLKQSGPLSRATGLGRATLITPPHHRLEQWTLPLELLRLRPDVLHSPDFIPPLRRPCPAAITIHDLAFRHFPEILDDRARRFYGQVQAAARSAEAIIAVSEATRADIVQLLGVPPERIDVVYEAAAPHFRPLGEARRAALRVNGHELAADGFLLFVSTIEPRKNIETLLRALRICLDRRPSAGYRLALAGNPGWHDTPIYTLVRDLRLGDQVCFLGGVASEELTWLYNACRLYLNPSRYEGFGLPALEALACGAPTVVADTSSLPEVVGDAALRLPPLDVLAWAEAIETLWHNPERRADLAGRGPAQAARFSWSRAAAETLAIYRRIGR